MTDRTGGATAPSRWDVLVIGGGAAGLTAAIAARHRGSSVLLLDAGSFDRPGGNTRHACDVRLPSPPGVPPTSTDLDRFGEDLVALGSSALAEPLLDATILGAAELAAFMEAHGAAFSGPYLGVLDPEPSMHFLVGGGLALVRAYCRNADRLGVVRASDARVIELCPGTDGSIEGVVATVAGRSERIDARAIVVASGGSESVDAAAAVPNAVVRGGGENTGLLFRAFGELGATFVGGGLDVVAVDERSPTFDGGRACAIDAVGYGIVLDRAGKLVYSASGSSWSDARRAVGSAVSGAEGARAAVCWDGTSHDRFTPTPWAPERAESLAELARKLGLDAGLFEAAAGSLSEPPFFGLWARPGVTFSRRGLLVDANARIVGGARGVFRNAFAAGEAMAGSIRPFGYRRGLGLTIAGVWGRIAARSASDVA